MLTDRLSGERREHALVRCLLAIQGLKMRLMFVVNVDWFFISHRLPIALEALRQGHEVHIATSLTDGLQALEDAGLIVHAVNVGRSESGPLSALRLIYRLSRLYRQVRPDIVHLVTIKPVLLGGIAARLAAVPAVVAAVSGLGFVFVSSGWKAGVRRRVVGMLYRLALTHRHIKVIFQNPRDAQTISALARLGDDQIALVPGSGVDLRKFRPAQDWESRPRVLMASRLLRDKGVFEFANAAKFLRAQGYGEGRVQFTLVGETDPGNPASLTPADVAGIKREGAVECLGFRSDMDRLLSRTQVVVLPSYREGMPKVLLEAASAGCAIVTTDVPGCRDAIIPEETGLLVPAKDDRGLAAAIESLILDAGLRRELGHAGRRLAEARYDVRSVVAKHMEIYSTLRRDCD